MAPFLWDWVVHGDRSGHLLAQIVLGGVLLVAGVQVRPGRPGRPHRLPPGGDPAHAGSGSAASSSSCGSPSHYEPGDRPERRASSRWSTPRSAAIRAGHIHQQEDEAAPPTAMVAPSPSGSPEAATNTAPARRRRRARARPRTRRSTTGGGDADAQQRRIGVERSGHAPGGGLRCPATRAGSPPPRRSSPARAARRCRRPGR